MGEVQRLRAVVVRNGTMVYPHCEDADDGNLVTFSDYAALTAKYEAERAAREAAEDLLALIFADDDEDYFAAIKLALGTNPYKRIERAVAKIKDRRAAIEGAP